ncbi:MAG TPA: potassium channel family protein [Actinomycetales bacterium]|nr:potassium channel family protein [Actinomycetales bacterium]
MGVPDAGDEQPQAVEASATKAPEQSRPIWHLLARTTSMIVLLTTAYYTWPLRPPSQDVASAVRLAGALVSAGLVGLVLWMQLRARRRVARELATIEGLLTLLYFLVVLFASTYYAMAHVHGQFSGLETRTDGLYFTVTTLATVGFGDIHAVGTAARALVTAQMLFTLLYLGTAVRMLTGTQVWARLPGTPEP